MYSRGFSEMFNSWRHCMHSSSGMAWYRNFSRQHINTASWCSQAELSTSDQPKDIAVFSQKRLNEICKQLRKSTKIKMAAKDFGIEDKLYPHILRGFCSLIRSSPSISPESRLSEALLAIHEGECLLDDLFPYFIEYARQKHPLVSAMRNLKMVSNLTDPQSWYPCTQSMKRNFVLHLGPTNSGKTHHAHQHFLSADSGVYCSPLRMLAVEIYHKTNETGVACDLITGEERLYASGCEEDPAHHMACTVEMADVYSVAPYDVAVIDEIQMIGDDKRGGAWTRALLGIPAKTVHICGEPTTLPLVKRLVESVEGELEVNKYDRLTPLVPLKRSLRGQYSKIRPGDCVVTFSRSRIFKIKREIETTTGQPCAVVYGGLPAAIRNSQAELFNSSKFKVLVASDAVGMGLNLNIKRLVFHTLNKFDGTDHRYLTPSQTRQIGGRAGRFGMEHTRGEVTTFNERDISRLHRLLTTPIPVIEKAGISPTLEQVELFSSHLPGLRLPKILSIFLKTAKVGEKYFLCEEALKRQIDIAELVSRYTITLKDSYILSLAPLDTRKSNIKAVFLNFIKLFSDGEPVTVDHLCALLHWPIPHPKSHTQMLELEEAHEMIDLYLWLSLRYPDLFPCPEESKQLQEQLEDMIGHSLKPKTRYKRRNYSNRSSSNLIA